VSIPTLVTFVDYFTFLPGSGFYFYRKSVSVEDYLLGGTGVQGTALSAQASKVAGRLPMGLAGAI